MAKIVSIGTALPSFRHEQKNILHFMQNVYGIDEIEKRKLAFLYAKSAIDIRYSVIEDFSLPRNEWRFWPREMNVFPTLDARMKMYKEKALPLALAAIKNCIKDHITANQITHLITVSCTGMSAPGLDLEIVEALNLPADIFRTSVNFMGCYAAVHAMKIANMICEADKNANVVFVCVELCTLHFKEEYTADNVASSLLFSDGCAAALMSNAIKNKSDLDVINFYSKLAFSGKNDMSWKISDSSFLMTLTNCVSALIEADIDELVHTALCKSNLRKEDITHWCIHPGGRKILDVIQKKLNLTDKQLQFSRNILKNCGNISSANILFVLNEMMNEIKENKKVKIFGVAFGPGLTMESFLVSAE